MKIIRPSHHTPATKVESWKEIKEEALELKKFIADMHGKNEGYHKSAFAISHAQVSYEPRDFFVINERVEGGRLLKEFGTWCIINPVILKRSAPVFIAEGCMSFPWRDPKKVQRLSQITVRYLRPTRFGFLLRTTKTLKETAAIIIQHEQDHTMGTNIYNKIYPEQCHDGCSCTTGFKETHH